MDPTCRSKCSLLDHPLLVPLNDTHGYIKIKLQMLLLSTKIGDSTITAADVRLVHMGVVLDANQAKPRSFASMEEPPELYSTTRPSNPRFGWYYPTTYIRMTVTVV